MSEVGGAPGRTAALGGLVAVGVGWIAGLVAYDRLITFMLDRGWLEQSDPLTPMIFAPWLLVLGVVVGALLTVADLRADRSPSRSTAVSRLLVAAGVSMTGLGLFHAHAVGQLWVPGPDFVIAKDLLYHVPGIALIVAGHYSRPVRVAQPADQRS